MDRIVTIPIEQLYYDADPAYGRQTLKGFYNAFKILEHTLPEIPTTKLQRFVDRYYPRLINVFESIKKEGMKNPIIVKELGPRVYRILVGNQRILVLNALKHKGTVLCHLALNGAKSIQDKVDFEYINGCEEAKRPRVC